MPNLVKTFLKRLTRTLPGSLNAIILVSLAVREKKLPSFEAWLLVVSVLVPLNLVVQPDITLFDEGSGAPPKAAEHRLSVSSRPKCAMISRPLSRRVLVHGQGLAERLGSTLRHWRPLPLC